MSLNTTAFFEVKKGENEYRFYLPPNAPIGEVYDAAFSVLMEITKLATESAEKAKRQDNPEAVEEDKEEEVPVEEESSKE